MITVFNFSLTDLSMQVQQPTFKWPQVLQLLWWSVSECQKKYAFLYLCTHIEQYLQV